MMGFVLFRYYSLHSTHPTSLKVYNHHIPQRNIDHLTPIQKLKEWRLKRPNLFKKRVYDLSGLNTYAFTQ